MTTAIVTVHFRNGIWNADAGFAFNLALVACAYVVSALGPGLLARPMGFSRTLDDESRAVA